MNYAQFYAGVGKNDNKPVWLTLSAKEAAGFDRDARLRCHHCGKPVKVQGSSPRFVHTHPNPGCPLED